MSANNTNPAQMLQYVQASSILCKRALDANAKLTATVKAAQELIPSIVDKLITTGAINAEQRKQATDALTNPAETLKMLGNAVDKMAEFRTKAASAHKQAGALGAGENADTGSVDASASLTSPFVGSRSGDVKKASDHAMFERLGLPH